jgi:transglycosylase-like protein with SLT domain
VASEQWLFCPMRSALRIRLTKAIIAVLALTALPCPASEVAVLKNGFAIKHERREVVGDVTRLYVSTDGSSFVDVPTASIEHYEAAPEEPGSRVPASPMSRQQFPARPQTDISQVVNDASGRYRLDPDLVSSVIKAESDFNVRAVSRKGAQGLMQLMPGTASQLGVSDAFDPQANVEGGTKYLRELMEKYNFDMVRALAAYNAGPQRVEQFGGVPPYYETRAYVARVVRDFNKKKAAQEKTAASKISQKSVTKASPGGSVSRVSQSAESKVSGTD